MRLPLVAALALVLVLAFAGTGVLAQVPALRDRAAELVDRGGDASGQSDAQVSAAEYVRVPRGITPIRLRELVGQPEARSKSEVEGVRLECWTYGIVGASGAFQFCFANGKLSSRFRYEP